MRVFKKQGELLRFKRINYFQNRTLSQQEVGRAVGVKNNGQQVSNIEKGKCGIPLKRIGDICAILKISEKEIIDAMLADYCNTLLNYLYEGKREISAIGEETGRTGPATSEVQRVDEIVRQFREKKASERVQRLEGEPKSDIDDAGAFYH